MATVDSTFIHTVILCTVIYHIQTAVSYELNCTNFQANGPCDPIICPANESCIVNCFGLDNQYDACSYADMHCTDDYPCTVNCLSGQACWSMKIHCPKNEVCKINAPYDQQNRAMAWAEIYGGENGILNIRNNADDGLELSTIMCPRNGICNIYSNNVAHDSSAGDIYTDAVINATMSNTLNLTVQGFQSPVYNSNIYCPMKPRTQTTPNCAIRVAEGGALALFTTTHIHTNQYTNLYLQGSGTDCPQCSVTLFVDCMGNSHTCEAVLVDGTDDEWECINKTNELRCPTASPSTSSSTTRITAVTQNTTTTSTTTQDTDTEGDFFSEIWGNVSIWGVVTIMTVSVICLVVVAVGACICCMATKRKNGDDHENEGGMEMTNGEPKNRLTTDTPSCRTNSMDTMTTRGTDDGATGPYLPSTPGEHESHLVPIMEVNGKIRLSAHVEGMHRKGIVCAACNTLVYNGKVVVHDGNMFICDNCAAMQANVLPVDDIDTSSDPSADDMYQTNSYLEHQRQAAVTRQAPQDPYAPVKNKQPQMPMAANKHAQMAALMTFNAQHMNKFARQQQPQPQQRMNKFARQQQPQPQQRMNKFARQQQPQPQQHMNKFVQQQQLQPQQHMNKFARQQQPQPQQHMNKFARQQQPQPQQQYAPFENEYDPQEEEYGTCVECGAEKYGLIFEKDMRFYCNDCWEYYENLGQ
eukprot:342336_1